MGEADGENNCNLTALCGLCYLHISINGFYLSALIDSDAMHSFVIGLVPCKGGSECGTVGSGASNGQESHYNKSYST